MVDGAQASSRRERRNIDYGVRDALDDDLATSIKCGKQKVLPASSLTRKRSSRQDSAVSRSEQRQAGEWVSVVPQSCAELQLPWALAPRVKTSFARRPTPAPRLAANCASI
jgi:hypothetical protein